VRRAAAFALAIALGAGHLPAQAGAVTPEAIAARGLRAQRDTMDAFAGEQPGGRSFGIYVFAVTRTTIGGRPVDLLTMNYTSNGSEHLFQADTLAVDAATLAPLWRRFHAKHDAASITFKGRQASGYSVRENEARVTVSHALSDDAFDAAMVRWILPLVPLQLGHRAAIKSFDIWRNAEALSAFTVTGSEVLQVGGAKIDCWVVEGPPGVGGTSGARRWIAKSTGRLMQTSSPSGGRLFWMVAR
jgi:hypothetical protein